MHRLLRHLSLPGHQVALPGNVIDQFFLINRFIDTKYSFRGVQILMDLISGREWSDSGHFPRVTLCDFDVRVLGSVHHRTVQCVLMINMFNEKIYIFVWFWLLLVATVTALNLLYWLLSALSSSSNTQTMLRFLRVSHHFEDGMDQRLVARFINGALRPDGVLVLRFVAAHAGDLVATELTGILWKNFANRLGTQAEARREHSHSTTENMYDPQPKKQDGPLVALMSAERNGYLNPPPAPLNANMIVV